MVLFHAEKNGIKIEPFLETKDCIQDGFNFKKKKMINRKDSEIKTIII